MEISKASLPPPSAVSPNHSGLLADALTLKTFDVARTEPYGPIAVGAVEPNIMSDDIVIDA